MSILERLALALHEADLGEECRAKGAARREHVGAYLTEAERVISRLHDRWAPKVRPEEGQR